MSVTNSGKGLYWTKNETLDIKLTEMAVENEYQGKKERNIGKKKFTHFITEDGKNKAMACEGGRLNCPYCRTGDKATMKFTTVVEHNSVNYYTDFPITLSRLLADAQMILRDTGMDDNAVLAVNYTVKRMDGAPYWDVRIKKNVQQQKVVEPVTNVPTNKVNEVRKSVGMAPKVIDVPDDIASLDLDATDDAVVALNDADIVLLKKYEPTIVKNLSKQADWDMTGALSTALKNNGWTADKIATAFKFFDDKGNFVLRSDLVTSG